MKKYLFCSLLFIFTNTFSQKPKFVNWSSTTKLSVNDFTIKPKQGNTSSFGQFSVIYQAGGFDNLAKDFNRKVRNKMIVAESWIDTTADVKESLRYQQTLFDICEIYTRQFRKDLQENRTKLTPGSSVPDALNNKALKSIAQRRMLYDKETKYGSDFLRQKEWEEQIKTELEALKEYSIE